jgi:tape measure domain-containing protein
MAALIGALRVTLGANTAQYEAGMRRAASTARRTGRDISGSMSQAQRVASNAFRGIAAAAGVTGVGAAAVGFARYVDAAKNLEAQLRLATRETGSFVRAQDDVRRIAASTRSGLEETANLYATFQRNSRELGISQEQAARATETVSKAFQISGATAAEASGGLRQFLQAIQSGTLRGEEFNSVLENAPRLARLIADSMNTTIGGLRALAEEGKITGDRLISALTNRRFTAGIDEEFRQLPVTFGQAMTLINNAAIETFGAFDRGGEFSQAITNFVLQFTTGTGTMSDAAEQAGIDIRSTFEGLGDVFAPFMENIGQAFDLLDIRIQSSRDSIADLFGIYDQLTNLVRRYGNFGTGASLPLSNAREQFLRRYDASDSRLQANADARRFGLNASGGRSMPSTEFMRYLNDPARYDMYGRSRTPPTRAPTAASGSGRSGTSAADRAERERLRQERNEESFRQDLARLNDGLLNARQALVVAAEAVAEFEAQQIEIERQRVNSSIQAEVTQRRFTQAQADQLIALNDQVAAERVRAIQLREAERIAEERAQIARADLDLQMELEQEFGNLARTTQARRESALRLLDLQQRQERLALEAVIASRQSTEAEKQIAFARLEMLDGLFQMRREGVQRGNLSPLRQLIEGLPQTADEINEAFENVSANGIQSMIDGLSQAAVGARSLGDVFKNVAQQILADLIRIQLQRAIVGPLTNALSGLLGGFGGSGGGLPFSSGKNGAWFGGQVGAIPGLATGGSIHVGGPAGVDRSMLSLNGQPIARVSRGETIGVGKGGRAVTFDLRGAVMTEDLLRQMESMSDAAAVRGAVGGRALTMDTLGRRARRSLNR